MHRWGLVSKPKSLGYQATAFVPTPTSQAEQIRVSLPFSEQARCKMKPFIQIPCNYSSHPITSSWFCQHRPQVQYSTAVRDSTPAARLPPPQAQIDLVPVLVFTLIVWGIRRVTCHRYRRLRCQFPGLKEQLVDSTD